MYKASVVILNWNGQKHLQQFLPSVVKHSAVEGVEVVVADNNSTDDSVAFLALHFPSVRVIKLDKNYGFAQGYNLALKQVDAKYYILLNSDVEVTANWIEPQLELMDADSTIAASMPKLKWYADKKLFEYAGAAGGFIDKYGYPFCRGRIFENLEQDHGQYENVVDIFWVTGAAMFVRAQSYDRAGGFDPDFFAHMEEIDLCWRFKGLGYRVIYNPASQVFHLGGGTLAKENPFKTYLNFRNNLFLLCKNLSPSRFMAVFITRMVLDGVAALMFCSSFRFSNAWAVFKAHLHFYRALPSTLRKRRVNMSSFVVFDHPQVFPRSIVVKRFLFGVTLFNQLKF